jgi:hypothetical protein
MVGYIASYKDELFVNKQGKKLVIKLLRIIQD